ncbi:MAG: CBS domain-containing protein [Methanosarcinales archaeon]|nr:MAG: CBS domain-containing protein [Methanosarcinales archaeon]
MKGCKVKDIMAEALTIDKSEMLSHALDLMEKHDVRRLLVTKDGKLIGVVTQRGIARALGTRKKSSLPASSLHVATAMSEHLATISPDDETEKAIQLLKGEDILAVVNGGLVGWVTPNEVLAIMYPKGYAGEIMKPPITTIPGDRVVHIRRRMYEGDIGRMPVIDDGQLVGMVTESDIARAMRAFRDIVPGHQQETRIRNLIVSDIMSVNAKFVRTNTPLQEVVDVILKENIGGVPVLDLQDNVVGIITRRDIVRHGNDCQSSAVSCGKLPFNA